MTEITYFKGGGFHAHPFRLVGIPDALSVRSTRTATSRLSRTTRIQPQQGYSIKFIGSGFTSLCANPTGGTITSVHVKDKHGHTYIIMDGTFADANLTDFWNKLHGFNAGDGPQGALDQLIGADCVEEGSDPVAKLPLAGNDEMDTYGTGNTLDGKGGADTFQLFHDDATATGGSGNDTFIIHTDLLNGAVLHGGLATGQVGKHEHNTLLLDAGDFGPQAMDGINKFAFSGSSDQLLSLRPSFFGPTGPGGLIAPHISVKGSIANVINGLIFLRDPGTAVNLDLSRVTDSDFARPNQVFIFDMAGDSGSALTDFIKGVPGAHNLIHLEGMASAGAGDDTAIGGKLSDELHGNSGANLLVGGKGRTSWGGTGTDTFQFKLKDSTPHFSDDIHGFSGAAGEGDVIDLHLIDANILRHGNQDFHFMGPQGFHQRRANCTSSTWARS